MAVPTFRRKKKKKERGGKGRERGGRDSGYARPTFRGEKKKKPVNEIGRGTAEQECGTKWSVRSSPGEEKVTTWEEKEGEKNDTTFNRHLLYIEGKGGRKGRRRKRKKVISWCATDAFTLGEEKIP